MKMSHTISFRVTELVLANNMLQSIVWLKSWLGVAYALIQRLLRFSNDFLITHLSVEPISLSNYSLKHQQGTRIKD